MRGFPELPMLDKGRIGVGFESREQSLSLMTALE